MLVLWIGEEAFGNMPNLREIHYHGRYLGGARGITDSTHLFQNNSCTIPENGVEPTEDNPWFLEEDCPFEEVIGISDGLPGPKDEVHFTYDV